MLTNKFIQQALFEAKKAFDNDEVPIGAIIVKENKIIARAYNSRKSNDCTAHAEILALRKACKKLKTSRLDDCDIYITLEPCLMCATAISLAHIKRVYYCLADSKFGAYENSNGIFKEYPSYNRPEIYSGICESEALKLMRDFFIKKR